MFRLTGWVETAGVAATIGLAAVVWVLPQFRFHRTARVGLAFLASAALWTVAVDYSWFREGCPNCGSHWDILEYRVFRQPIWSWKGEDHCPSVRLIAEDLGAPCPHKYERWQKWRLWGLLFPAPCHNGICCLSGGDWYVTADRARMRKLAAANPKLGGDFRQHALVQQNWAYLRKFIDDFNTPSQEAVSK